MAIFLPLPEKIGNGPEGDPPAPLCPRPGDRVVGNPQPHRPRSPGDDLREARRRGEHDGQRPRPELLHQAGRPPGDAPGKGKRPRGFVEQERDRLPPLPSLRGEETPDRLLRGGVHPRPAARVPRVAYTAPPP